MSGRLIGTPVRIAESCQINSRNSAYANNLLRLQKRYRVEHYNDTTDLQGHPSCHLDLGSSSLGRPVRGENVEWTKLDLSMFVIELTGFKKAKRFIDLQHGAKAIEFNNNKLPAYGAANGHVIDHDLSNDSLQ